MKRRSLFIVFVAGALLFGVWGNVVAAAFCPRFALNRDCCPKEAAHQAKQVEHLSSCRHEMAGMEMDDMQMEPEVNSDPNAQDLQVQLSSESSSDMAGLQLPIEPCAHCLSHSQTTSGTVSIIAVDPSKRLVETDSLPTNLSIDLSRTFADLIAPSEHGPPSPSSPRHVMINVFRI